MTATATKKRGRPRKADNRQREIADGEGKPLNGADRIAEIDRLGIELDNVRTKRIELNEEEGRCQSQVAAVMKKHDLTTYALPNGKKLELTHEEKDKVKVRTPKLDGSED